MVIGIVGVGGLGSIGIKLAKAMGHTVVAISTSAHKEQMARDKGADHFCCTTDPASMEKHKWFCDLVLNTVSKEHDIMQYFTLVKKKGVLCQLGIIKDMQIHQWGIATSHYSLVGSLVGGIKDTEDCLEFCKKHEI